MAKFNGIKGEMKATEKLLTIKQNVQTEDISHKGGDKDQTVWQEIYSSKKNMTNLAAMCMVWLSASFGYYLISY